MNPARRALAYLRNPVRLATITGLLVIQSACMWCVPNAIPPMAAEHADFCAQYIGKGQLVEAEARCKLAIEYTPKFALPYNLLGLIEHTRGRKELAVEYFKRALSLKNDFAEAHNNLGAIFLENHEYEPAEDQFRQAIEIDPGYVSARVNLGLVLLYQAKDAEARDQYLRCLEIDPNTCDCQMGLGLLAVNKEDYQDARSHFQEMTRICPQDQHGYYNLGWTYIKLVRCAEAVDVLVQAVALQPDYLEARNNLVAAYDCLGKQDGAVLKWMDKIRASPGDPDPHFQLGAIYEDERLYDRALNEFLNAIKLDPDGKISLAYFRAARLYDRALQTQDTINYCQKFVDLLRDEQYAKEREWCRGRVKELQFQ